MEQDVRYRFCGEVGADADMFSLLKNMMGIYLLLIHSNAESRSSLTCQKDSEM